MAEGFPEYPPRTALPNLTLHPSTDRASISASSVASSWFAALLQSISSKDTTTFQALFLTEAWWRDSVGFSWTITSKNGPQAISELVLTSDASIKAAGVVEHGALAPQVLDMGPGMTVVQFGYEFETQRGRGRGVVRLGNDGPGSWKAWTVSSQLDELREPTNNDKDNPNDTNGADHDGCDTYQVLIVGAGQSGVMLGAWLDRLNISYLIVDKASSPGDAWRARYAAVKAHTPKYSDHFPFADFPESYPVWPGRNDMADWIDEYSKKLDVRIRHDTTVTSVRTNSPSSSNKYSVSVRANDTGAVTVYVATHVVLATGIFPSIPIIPAFPGLDAFPGRAYHTSAHTSAGHIPDVSAKNVVVVGAGTSAHDVAQDFVEHGAKSVTIVQRSRIWSASTAAVEKFIFAPWGTPGVDTSTADLLGTSMPAAVPLTLGGAGLGRHDGGARPRDAGRAGGCRDEAREGRGRD